MGYKPSIVERMNRGLNFQKRNSLLKKSSPLRDTDPHTGEGGHSHAGNTAGSSTFSNVLPTGTRSTFQGSTTATFDPNTVETQKHITGKNYLESTEASIAAYNALSDEDKAKQDREALALQAKENLRVQNINNAIDIANQEKLKEAEQEFNVNQQNLSTSQEFTIGDATEAQEQQATMSKFETFNSELAAARTAALENAGDVFSSAYQERIVEGDTPEEARLYAADLANTALAQAAYFNREDFQRFKERGRRGFDQYNDFEPGQQIQYIQGGRNAQGIPVSIHGGVKIFDSSEIVRLPGRDYGSSNPGERYTDIPQRDEESDLYGIRYEYFDEKGRPIDYKKYLKLQKRGKNPTENVLLGSELQKYFQQFQ